VFILIQYPVRNEGGDNFYVDGHFFHRNLWETPRRRSNIYKVEDTKCNLIPRTTPMWEKVPYVSYKSCINEQSTSSNLFSTCSVGFYTTRCFGFSSHLQTFKPPGHNCITFSNIKKLCALRTHIVTCSVRFSQ
jgi:hypothetical protein